MAAGEWMLSAEFDVDDGGRQWVCSGGVSCARGVRLDRQPGIVGAVVLSLLEHAATLGADPGEVLRWCVRERARRS